MNSCSGRIVVMRKRNREREKAKQRESYWANHEAEKAKSAERARRKRDRDRELRTLYERMPPTDPTTKLGKQLIRQCRRCRERASIGLWPCDRHNSVLR